MDTQERRTAFTIVRLTAIDAIDFRELRLDGLRKHPEAFGASWEDECRQTEAQYADRLERAVVFGGRAVVDDQLVGVVGLRFPEAAKLRHKATLWGMYVRQEARRTGLGAALLAAAMSHTASRVEEVILTVRADNISACGLYRNAGFGQYGLEQRALKIGDDYHDELLMFSAV